MKRLMFLMAGVGLLTVSAPAWDAGSVAWAAKGPVTLALQTTKPKNPVAISAACQPDDEVPGGNPSQRKGKGPKFCNPSTR
jgi:hypothetical protein